MKLECVLSPVGASRAPMCCWLDGSQAWLSPWVRVCFSWLDRTHPQRFIPQTILDPLREELCVSHWHLLVLLWKWQHENLGSLEDSPTANLFNDDVWKPGINGSNLQNYSKELDWQHNVRNILTSSFCSCFPVYICTRVISNMYFKSLL